MAKIPRDHGRGGNSGTDSRRTRRADHHRAGAEYIVSPDMSCVMHQQGCARRAGLPLKFMHIAQVLNGARA